MMKQFKAKKFFFYSLNIILLIILVILLGIAFFIEKPLNDLAAKKDERRVVLSIGEADLANPPAEVDEGEAVQNQPDAHAVNADAVVATVPTVPTDAKPDAQVALVITNLGVMSASTSLAISMPEDVTLGFSAYAANLNNYIDASIAAKHEVLINVPLGDASNQVSDNIALIASLSPEENQTRLINLLSINNAISGIYTDQQEKYTGSPAAVDILIKTLVEYKKIFVYGRVEQDLLSQASKEGLQIVNRAITIDGASEQVVYESLAKLEQSAATTGSALAYVDLSNPSVYKIIMTWIGALESKKLKLTPISKIDIIRKNDA